MDLTITTIQTALFWEDKQANLKMLTEKILSIPQKTELVILPEMFSTGFSMQPKLLAEKMDGETIQWMKDICKKKNIILTGSLIIEEDKKYYNRLIWMLPNGHFGFYDKRHLFGYAKENEHYSAGNKRLIASVKGWKVNLLICYDLRFPVWSRQAPKEGDDHEYDLLLYVANWPEKRSSAWNTLLQARAIENQCYVVGVNRVGYDGHNINHTGNTGVIDPLGDILYHKTDDEDIFTITLQRVVLDEVRKRFPFLKDRDNFNLL
ncbi:MAG: nitrilase family protein [Bacteroidota bacterium]